MSEFTIEELSDAPCKVCLLYTSISWGALAGAFLGPYIYGLYWKRASKASVWVSFIFAVVFMLSLIHIWTFASVCGSLQCRLYGYDRHYGAADLCICCGGRL